MDVDALQRKAEDEFSQLWEEGKVPGWEITKSNGAIEGIWCPACMFSIWLPSYSWDLQAGSGQRQYAKQTVYDAHLSSKKHQKAAEKLKADGDSTNSAEKLANGSNSHANGTNASASKTRQPARLTHLITSLIITLLPTLAETKSNVERRFSLTAREREEELVEDAPVAAPPTADGAAQEEEPDEEERIYNPLKLPLGWDGKPIPYWLYKLHGLGVEYRCEICSDFVYMGRKNFERHFQVCFDLYNGVRCLILFHRRQDTPLECVLWVCPIQSISTKSPKFKMRSLVRVILNRDTSRLPLSFAVAEKLKREGRKEISQNETTEEMEDEEGNVYDRKTYEDLKKQGII